MSGKTKRKNIYICIPVALFGFILGKAERQFSGNKFAPRIGDVSLTVNDFSFEEGKLFVLHSKRSFSPNESLPLPKQSLRT